MTQSNPNIGRDTCASVQGNNAYPGAPLIVNDCGLNACNKYWNYVGGNGYDRTKVPTVCGGISPTPPPAQPQQSPADLGTRIIANLFNKNSVFDIYGNNSANQTAVTMFSRSGNMNQKFSYYADGKIRALAGKCLDSGSGNLGDWIRINDCTGGWNQKWNVVRDYSISQVNGNNNQTYCIGTDNGATNGNPRLVLKSCTNINDCSTYWEIENISDYSPSLVNTQGCGSFSNGSNNNNPTPSTPPSYTPPTPSPSPTPTPGGGTNTPTFVPLAEELEPYNDTQYNQFLNSNFTLNIPYEASGIENEVNKLTNSINSRYNILTTNIVNCNNLAKCGTVYLGALWNLANVIARYFWGILKGTGQVAVEAIFDILTTAPSVRAAASEVTNNPNPTAIYYTFLENLNSYNIKGLVVKAGEVVKVGALGFVDYLFSRSSNDWYQLFEDIGYWMAIIGSSVLLIGITVLDLGKTLTSLKNVFSRIGGLVKSGYNVAKSITNSANEIKLTGLTIKNISTSFEGARITGYEIARLTNEGKQIEIQQIVNKYLFNRTLTSYFNASKSPNFEKYLKIANHSYGNHINEFENLTNIFELAQRAEEVVNTANYTKVLSNGRKAFYRSIDNNLVIENSIYPTKSTIFRPKDGINYYNNNLR